MRISYLGAAALAAVSLFQTGAYAQMTGNITASIPFSFHVGDYVLPAGSYTLTELASRDIEVRNDKTNQAVLELGTSEEALHPPKKTELLFNRYGNNEFLRQIKIGGETDGIEFLPSQTERKVMDGGQQATTHWRPAKHNSSANHS